MNKEFTVYESWDVQSPPIPKRSRLYPLEPISLGTPFVESLIGYVSRLSEAYCVPTGLLVLSEIAPLMKVEYALGDKEGGLDKLFANQTRALNGTGNWPKAIVQSLESLTLRTDLRHLTMLPWAHIIPQRGLLKPIRAWCPRCYGDWQIKGQPFYEPLLWSLSCVKVCLHHRQPLYTTCPTCNKANRPLAWLSRPGYCSKCKQWLGSYERPELAQAKEESEWDWHAWVIQNIGDLLASSSSKFYKPSRESISIVLSHHANTQFSGNISAFARWLGLDRVQVNRWIVGQSTPRIDTLLKICFRFRIPLLEFLDQKITIVHLDEETKHLPAQPEVESYFPKSSEVVRDSEQVQQMKAALAEDPPPSLAAVAERLGYKRTTTLYYYASDLCHAISAKYVEYQKAVQLKNIQSELETVLTNGAYPPPSLQQVVQSIGISVQTLKKHCPELCSSISSRYAMYLSEGRAKRIQILEKEIRKVAAELHNQGIEPTASRISPYLEKPRSILQKEAKAALRKVRHELGWEK